MEPVQYANKSEDDTLKALNSSRKGLTHSEAEKRILQYGENSIKNHHEAWLDILLRQFTSPFLYLLIGAAVLSFSFGERIDGSMIVIFIVINTVLGFYQEYKSEQTLKLLTTFIKNNSHVMRDGTEESIPSSHIVPGDILVLNAGDIVAADVRVLEETNLTIDESALTGESVNIKKQSEKMAGVVKEMYKAANICFSGTTVVTGKAFAIVLATGKNTEIGKISNLSTETKRESGFQKNISRFSKFILYLILGTLVLVFITNIAIKGVGEIPHLLIFSIALAVSVIPEALPVVITFSLSRGALRLAHKKVVVKRLSSIEDLGSIEILCTDKTGTLTENVMTIAGYDPHSKEKDILLYAGLATTDLHEQNASVHSFDKAILNAITHDHKKLLSQYDQIKENPFDPVRKRSSYVVKKGKEYTLVVKGAPEELIKLSKKTAQTKAIQAWIKNEGVEGKRVVAIAYKTISSPEKFTEDNLTLVGCISFVDPVKESVGAAISQAKFLGVKIKILTGDSADVAGAVAKQIGLIDDAKDVLTGEMLEAMSPEAQHKAVQKYDIFARVSPTQKYTIIHLLERDATVGFLGEGINDAPALKIANVGLVVAGATDVARESADIILLKKSLKVIIEGIQEGRIIFTNTSKYIKATLSSNFGNFYTVAITSLFITFLPLLPLQILLINMLTDFPMIAVATDTVDAEEVQKPKHYDLKDTILLGTVLGVVSTLFDFIFFIMYYRQSPAILQTNWFIGSVLTELIFLFSVRTRKIVFEAKRPSGILLVLSLGAFATAIILPFTQIGHELFSFITPTGNMIFLTLVIVCIYFVSTETVKLLYYKLTT